MRHRNTLYVALKRLRTILANLCGNHRGELIETVPGGWRLVAGVVARKAS
jgi:DNA-binding winged helix-turn-helix (wHTH) protein